MGYLMTLMDLSVLDFTYKTFQPTESFIHSPNISIMCPPNSLLAPPLSASIAPPSTGPTLRPRTPTRPKPGFIALSPDLRVSSLRVSPGLEPTESDHTEDNYIASSGQSDTSDGIGSQEVIEIHSDDGSLPDATLPDPSNKKKNTRKAKVHVVKS
ncbi:uncharacterized protein MELLADRAFT_89769 [Melampsora larici-populina 98AG31]|uniref:Uncharacterized protein n=1 Tax=Melampsora larici-populina (strain 98AG31 / pathotype 3-4-7) TaxID=747676 RepID=F4RUJ9_MELLP|nr:uncharacterized protein MELLADRAFT_89769 [Melampsora larici-populina 98AG31]EGG03983.1 hypothetical protein MELLADRAFT_89769 [Melampsora larici-populina 98AG31]